jgi:hypothetical protein
MLLTLDSLAQLKILKRNKGNYSTQDQFSLLQHEQQTFYH